MNISYFRQEEEQKKSMNSPKECSPDFAEKRNSPMKNG